MKLICKLFVFLALVATSILPLAAQPVLSVPMGGLTCDKDSVDLQINNPTYLNYTVKVVNEGPGAYTGPITMYAEYRPKGYLDTAWADTVVTDMGAGDTITFQHQDGVTPTSGRFKGGGNIVIVWPYAGNAAITGDTGTVNVHIDGIVSIDRKIELQNRMVLFPNPAQTRINLQFKAHKNKFEYVRIIDLRGKEYYRTEKLVDEVDTEKLPRGIYLVEVQYSDGIKGAYKLILTQ